MGALNMKYEYLIGTEKNPYRNLAIEQELMDSVRGGTAFLFLWQNEDTIVLGRNQGAESECRIDEFLSTGGTIARRRSGGGAVYHDAGNLNFSIICLQSESEICQYQKIVKDALEVLGIAAEYNGRNDILVEGRKCSGNAVYEDGDALCQHGTLLVNTDIERMEVFLTPDKSKLDRNHVASISSRVINLCEIDSAISIEKAKMAFIQAVQAVPSVTSPEEDRLDELMAFYGSRSWVYGGKR